MNLRKKKALVARVLGVGIDRVSLDSDMQQEIKEAITRQDILDLKNENVIKIKDIRGRKAKLKRKTRKRLGSRKNLGNTRKMDYVYTTRKLRAYAKSLKKQGKINNKEYKEIRSKIKSKIFRNLKQVKGVGKK